MSLERYRRFLLELYHVVWHFNPRQRGRGAESHRRRPPPGALLPCMTTCRTNRARRNGCSTTWCRSASRPRTPAPGARASIPWRCAATTTGPPIAASRARSLGMMYVLEVIASVYAGPFATAVKEALLSRRARHLLHRLARLDGRRAHGEPAYGAEHAARRTVARAIVESTLVNFGLFTPAGVRAYEPGGLTGIPALL